MPKPDPHAISHKLPNRVIIESPYAGDIDRNTIYARHGRQFKSKLLQEYFDTMEWYKPDPAFTDKRLNKIDVTNVRMIKSVEDTLGGSLTEDEQRAEDNMSGF